ncbi:MAG: fluoride efflux transporter FluC [Gammaproteobacteria bacterium]|tara:strand:- start:30 stop:386 length:357 start_codon:yes stop_codon:yes gene_type:complete
MINLLLVGIGGSLGAMCRYALTEFIHKYIPTNFPSGTFFVNLIGCFLIGVFVGYYMQNKDSIYFLFIIGFLGSFTTMSAFTIESVNLFNTNFILAASYIILTILFTLLATYIGIQISK